MKIGLRNHLAVCGAALCSVMLTATACFSPEPSAVKPENKQAPHKTLIPVIGYIAAEFPVPPFGCHHTLVGSLLRTVDTRHIHCLVGLLVVLHITERRPQVLVQELFIGGFIGVLRIVDYFL